MKKKEKKELKGNKPKISIISIELNLMRKPSTRMQKI